MTLLNVSNTTLDKRLMVLFDSYLEGNRYEEAAVAVKDLLTEVCLAGIISQPVNGREAIIVLFFLRGCVVLSRVLAQEKYACFKQMVIYHAADDSTAAYMLLADVNGWLANFKDAMLEHLLPEDSEGNQSVKEESSETAYQTDSNKRY